MVISTTPQEYRATDPHALTVVPASGGPPVLDVDTLTRTLRLRGRLMLNTRDMGLAHERLDSHMDAYNGTFIEPFTFAVVSDGVAVIGTLDRNPTGDLTERFSDGYSTVSTTLTIVLTPGSDTAPQKNFVYILQSAKGVLVVSTSDWPSEEHIKIAEVILQTVGTTQTEGGPLVTRFWNDHAQGINNQGHHTHAWQRLRFEHALWASGVAITWTIDAVPSPDTVHLALTAGKIYQLHLHDFEAKDTTAGDNVHVVNDSVSPYTEITDFASLLTDSAGISMSGRYFNLVVWASISSGSEKEHLFVNLPSGSYNKLSDALADVSGFTVFDIPSDFRGIAFLVTRITLRHQAAGGGTWTSERETDLRGQVPNIIAGGGTAAITTEFSDNQFKLFDEGDPTKELEFQLSGITTGTTRTLTVQDADGTIALTADLHNEGHVLATTGPHTGALPWADLDFTGSSLADLITRAHANLSDAPADAHHVSFVQADADLLYDALGGLATHEVLDTGVHGAGGDVLTTDADISTHAGLTGVHHAVYLDSDAIAAVEGELTLVLTGEVSIASGKSLSLLTDGSTGGLKFGASADVFLFRGAANRLDLGTGDDLRLVSGGIELVTGKALKIFSAFGDANPLAQLSWFGLDFGPGGASPLDMGIGPATIFSTRVLMANTGSTGMNAGDSEFSDFLAPDTILSRLVLRLFSVSSGSGKDANARAHYAHDRLEFGAGGAAALDVNLYRNAADELKTDDKFIVGAGLDVTGNSNFGAYYLDIDDIAVPADPGAGIRRLFVDTATGELSVRTNAGATVSLEGALTGHDHTGAGDGGVLTDDEHDGFSEYGEIAIPSAPATDKGRLFAAVVETETELYWRRPSAQAANQVQRISRSFAYDTFGRADSSALGDLESGQAWTEDGGDWEIAANELEVVSTGADTLATFPLGYQENLHAVITLLSRNGSGNNDMGFVFRYVDTDNYLLLQLVGTSAGNNGFLKLFKKEGGGFTQLGSGSLSTALNGVSRIIMILNAHGGIITAECYQVEGARTSLAANLFHNVVANTWSATLQGGLKAGIRIGNTGDTADFFSVEAW